MANPTVEKLKEAGLRYGDKVAVALTSLLFLVCFGLALNKKSIEITPEEVKKAAETADANINRRQDPEAIVKILEENNIKLTHFAKDVEDSAKSLLVADNYRPDREWITPEPGAGLLRDQPKLIAPTELYAYPGRGGALVFALDEQGKRIVDTEKKEPPKEERRGRRGRRGRGGSMGYGAMMGGMMGGNAGMMGGRRGRRSSAEMEREQKEQFEQQKRDVAAKLAGRDEAPAAKDEAEKNEQGTGPQEQYKEVTKALHWVAVTGVIDHGKLVANYREALKSQSAPHYARLELERQTLQKDGSWSDWEKVDAEENLKVLDNLPEEDEELTPDNVRPDNLNDPLPFLKSGLWEKVHIASLVPKEKKEVAPPPTMMGGMGGNEGGRGGGYAAMMGRMGGGGMMGGGGSAAMMRGMGGSGGYGAMMGRMGAGGMMGGSGGFGAMMRGMGSNEGGMGGYMGGMGGGSEPTNFWKSDEKRVMIRALDFTAEPDTTYRYHIRVVVFNPNHNREDVSYGVDTKATELSGPWSEPTDEVTMPADVAAYAMGIMPRDPKSDLKVNFQVIRFDLNNGVTVPRKFAAGPGEVVGEVSTADIPTAEGTGKTTKPVDFNTRMIVLDTAGGMQPLPSGFTGGAVERPALALLLRPDGSVQARSQPDDENDAVRRDIERNYAREVKDSNKKRESSMGSGYGGMMMMMGGMRGMGGMGGGSR